MNKSCALRIVGIAMTITLGISTVALAGTPLPVPAPVAGAGVPALLAAGAALWAVRKFGKSRHKR